MSHQLCGRTELSLFSEKPLQTSVLSSSLVEYLPQSDSADASTLKFRIAKSPGSWLNFGKSFLHIQAKVVKMNGTALEAGDTNVAPVNFFGHALWKSVNVFANGRCLTSSEPTYAHKAYLTNVLSYSKEYLETQGRLAVYYPDTPGSASYESVDSAAVGDAKNEGFNQRAKLCALSKPIDMCTRIHCDLFEQERFLLNSVDLQIEMVRNSHPFVLMSGTENAYKVVITSAKFLACVTEINPDDSLIINQMLETNMAKYPISRRSITVRSQPAGAFGIQVDGVFSSQLPNRIYVMLVDDKGMNGNEKKNPWYLQHYNLLEFCAYVDGKAYPNQALKMNFKNNEVAMAYNHLFWNQGQMFADECSSISMEQFCGGMTIIPVNLSPVDGDCISMKKQGNLRIEMRFENELPNTINVIVLGEFTNQIEVNGNREFTFDYK